jgi:hypothetical protein
VKNRQTLCIHLHALTGIMSELHTLLLYTAVLLTSLNRITIVKADAVRWCNSAAKKLSTTHTTNNSSNSGNSSVSTSFSSNASKRLDTRFGLIVIDPPQTSHMNRTRLRGLRKYVL